MNNVKKASFKIKKDDLYLYWLNLTRPIHKLPNADVNILVELLKLRDSYKGKILDDEILDEIVLSTKNRLFLMEKLDNMSPERFNNLLSDLRRRNVLQENKINPAYIPKIQKDTKKYSIVFELLLE